MNFKFDGSKVFFTSDTHFYHGNIIRFCNRPFKDVETMNETIISNWNNTVGQDDIVFHLGDFCLGGSAEWTRILNRLNGRIYLIMGNHDLKNIRQGYIDRFEHVAMQMCGSCSDMYTQERTIPELTLPGFSTSIRHSMMSELTTTTIHQFHLNKSKG